MQNDKDLFSDEIDKDVIDKYFYGKCQSTADYGKIFERIMKKLNRMNQMIELKSKGIDK
jgi:hypothetical protein